MTKYKNDPYHNTIASPRGWRKTGGGGGEEGKAKGRVTRSVVIQSTAHMFFSYWLPFSLLFRYFSRMLSFVDLMHSNRERNSTAENFRR